MQRFSLLPQRGPRALMHVTFGNEFSKGWMGWRVLHRVGPTVANPNGRDVTGLGVAMWYAGAVRDMLVDM